MNIPAVIENIHKLISELADRETPIQKPIKQVVADNKLKNNAWK